MPLNFNERLRVFKHHTLRELLTVQGDVQLAAAALRHAWQTQPALHSHTRVALGTLAATFGITAVAALSVAPMIADEPAPTVNAITINIEPQGLAAQAAALEAANTPMHAHVRQPGNTSLNLNTLLSTLGVDDDDAADYVRKSPLAQKLFARNTRSVSTTTTDDGTLQSLKLITLDAAINNGTRDYSATQWSLLRDESTAAGYTLTYAPAALDARTKTAKGVIRSTLFAAADEADVPDNVTVQLAEIFDGEIDFHTALRKGDEFQITYESLSLDGEPVRAGRLLSAVFVNKGQRYEALWFKPSDGGQAGYYTFDGKSLRQAFLRTPLEFSRISSGFGGRVHPISRNWKQHKGVDFSAPTGTSIRAASDGVVKMAGKGAGKGYTGYGNVIELEHRGGISTLYGHLSGFAAGVRNGAKVKQGDVIGYVGSTGWSTGPHLHYEFRVKGEHVNPLTVPLPAAAPINAPDMKAFAQLRDDTAHQLALATQLRVARAK
jgi:murein DD-endopeptidase MepM/ murein hydrolase activator NlpD